MDNSILIFITLIASIISIICTRYNIRLRKYLKVFMKTSKQISNKEFHSRLNIDARGDLGELSKNFNSYEIIVVDDCSNDNTISICEKWLETYGHRFVNTKIVTVPINMGTSANCNRAIREAQGEWFKGLAGDDIFCPDCGKTDFTDIRKFNLMFKTFQGVTEDAKAEIFLRPETAQGIFVNFKNVLSIETSEMIHEAVLQGVGVGYILRDVVKKDIETGKVKVLDIKEKLPYVTVNLVYIDKYLMKAPKEFIDNYLKK